MKTIKTDNKEVDLFITGMSQGSDKPMKLAICLKKVPEGNMKIVHTISDEDIEYFLEEIKWRL